MVFNNCNKKIIQLDLQLNIYYPIIINNIEYINDLAISNLPYKLDRRSNLEIISQRLVLVNQNTPYTPREYYGNTITLTHRVIPKRMLLYCLRFDLLRANKDRQICVCFTISSSSSTSLSVHLHDTHGHHRE